MIKSIVFDWGGVLIEDPSLKMFEYCAKVLQVSRQEFFRIYEKFIQDFQRGTLSEQMLWETICSELRIKQPTLSSLWGTAFRHAYIENKQIFLLASTLKKNGYRIGLLSNTEVPAMRFFHKQKYTQFDVTVFSCAEGTRKPEEGIYDILLKRLDVQSEEVLFIDDNEEYVRGAQQVGINAVLFMDYPQLEQKLRLLLKQL